VQQGRCLQKLTAKAYTVPQLPLDYSASKENTVISEGWNDFFSNSDQSKYGGKCPIVGCALLEEDCKTPWNHPGMAMENTYPYRIKASQQVILGLKSDACV